ncbi:hypothetical protein HBB16_14820 [Pseudonocardia sp. MCCB 268]|nr:hypothetical protein [Pseudonocardia cytotoxica]
MEPGILHLGRCPLTARRAAVVTEALRVSIRGRRSSCLQAHTPGQHRADRPRRSDLTRVLAPPEPRTCRSIPAGADLHAAAPKAGPRRDDRTACASHRHFVRPVRASRRHRTGVRIADTRTCARRGRRPQDGSCAGLPGRHAPP